MEHISDATAREALIVSNTTSIENVTDWQKCSCVRQIDDDNDSAVGGLTPA
jgi:hypothetical protein